MTMAERYSSLVALVLMTCSLPSTTVALKPTKLVTFNTALIEIYPLKTQRRDVIIQQLSALDADAVCLQEVFYSNDVKEIVNGLSEKYPHSFSSLHRPNGTLPNLDSEMSPCTFAKFTEFQQCAISYCLAFKSDKNKFITCLITKCSTQLISMKTPCLLCLLFSANPLSPASCANSSITDKAINIYGTLFLSKQAITSSALKPFDSGAKQIRPRALLEMRIQNIKGIVACTHLTANQTYAFFEPYLPHYTSHEERNKGQVRQMLAMYKEERNLILMGGFNTGPRQPKIGIEAEFPKSYNLIRKARPALSESNLKRCTFCKGTIQTEIDHILMRGHTLMTRKRVLDNNTTIPLSDHYGVEVIAGIRG